MRTCMPPKETGEGINMTLTDRGCQVPGCSFCTKSLCFEHIKEPIGSCDEVSATCVDYDTYWRLTVILLILFLLFSLLIIGCLRDVPVVSR